VFKEQVNTWSRIRSVVVAVNAAAPCPPSDGLALASFQLLKTNLTPRLDLLFHLSRGFAEARSLNLKGRDSMAG
jgi:hypothetical protein